MFMITLSTQALEKMRIYEQNMEDAKRTFDQISDEVRANESTSAASRITNEEEFSRKQHRAFDAIKKRVDSIRKDR